MRHFANPAFWQAYAKLPRNVQRLADSNFALLKDNPHHSSLRLKKVGHLWSVRVGIHYRAFAVEAEGDLVWFWIGSHAAYDSLIR